jgi:hypothetical protein
VCQANALPTFSFPVCTNYSDNCLNDSKAIKHCPLTSPFFKPSVLCFYVFSSWISTVKVIIYCLLPLISPHCVCTHTHTHTHTHTPHTHTTSILSPAQLLQALHQVGFTQICSLSTATQLQKPLEKAGH